MNIKASLIVLGALVAGPVFAQDASLYLDPATGTYPIGEPMTVEVRINTGGTNVGTADASVSFDPADLEFVAVSDDSSIFDTILVDSGRVPGRVDVSGFINRGRPAFAGDDGLMAVLTFVPLRNVATELRFASAAATPPLSLQASVGDLTNVLTNLQAATYTLVPREQVPAVAAVAYASEPAEFEITPLPVPDGEWFGSSTVKLSWSLPSGVAEMRTTVSSDPNATPDTEYPIPVSSVELTGIPDGTNYFLLQFKYGSEWATPIRYDLKVDTEPPSYVIVKEKDRSDGTDPRVGFVVEGSDAQSGVAYYEVGVDGATPVLWEKPENDTYYPEGLNPGEHVLTVVAYDEAGNSTTIDTTFLVKSLETPVLTDVPDRVLTGDPIVVRGETYPDANVTAFVSLNDGEARERVVKSDGTGQFRVEVAEAAKAGKYTVWFSVTDDRGATSPTSIKRSVEVTQPYIMLFGGIAVTYLSIIVPLLGLIVLLGLILWLGYTYVRGLRTRVRRETGEAYGVVRGEFKELRAELIKQIGVLEKANQSRELTREEMRIFRDLSRRLDRIEEHISEEVDDIADIDDVVAETATTSIEAPRTVAPGESAQHPAGGSVHTVHIQPR